MGEWRRRPGTRALKSKFPCADLVLTGGRQHHPHRQGKVWLDTAESSGLDRVREAARKDGDLRFTALLHHADVDALRRSFLKLRKTAAVGIDGVSWQDYEQALEENLTDRHVRIHRGSDRVRRFVDEVTRNWLRAIRRRSQRGKNSWTWERMRRLGRKHLP